MNEDTPVLAKKRRKSHFVRVLVFDNLTDDKIREHKVDYSDHSKRMWLSGLIVWATSNKKSVEIEAV